MGELNGKVAIVTGAGRLRSIGRATAVALAQLGADVVVTGTGRDPVTFPPDEKAVGWKDIESTAEHVREKGRRALALVADVTSVDDSEMMMQRTLEEFGDALGNQQRAGYLQVEGAHVRLTRKGLLQADSLLPEYFEPEYRRVRYT